MSPRCGGVAASTAVTWWCGIAAPRRWRRAGSAAPRAPYRRPYVGAVRRWCRACSAALAASCRPGYVAVVRRWRRAGSAAPAGPSQRVAVDAPPRYSCGGSADLSAVTRPCCRSAGVAPFRQRSVGGATQAEARQRGRLGSGCERRNAGGSTVTGRLRQHSGGGAASAAVQRWRRVAVLLQWRRAYHNAAAALRLPPSRQKPG